MLSHTDRRAVFAARPDAGAAAPTTATVTVAAAADDDVALAAAACSSCRCAVHAAALSTRAAKIYLRHQQGKERRARAIPYVPHWRRSPCVPSRTHECKQDGRGRIELAGSPEYDVELPEGFAPERRDSAIEPDLDRVFHDFRDNF